MIMHKGTFQSRSMCLSHARFAPYIAPGSLLLITILLAGLLGLSPASMVYAVPPTGFVVTSLSDNDSGSLRAAIAAANTNPVSGPVTITFSVNGTIILTSTLPAISPANNSKVTIDGTGHSITVSGNNKVQVMVVNAGMTLTLQSITIANGAGLYGGGISNTGTLIVTNSTFSGNHVSLNGGGIWNNGALIVTNSTFSGNSAFFGGGIFNAPVGTSTVTNNTFSGNSASHGGGIANAPVGTSTVTNNTFSGNSAAYGSGIENFNGTLAMTNTILANSPPGVDCLTVGTVTGSHNLISDTVHTCGLTTGNLIGVDPKLGPLANNGGSTLTFAPLLGSPAIDAGDNASCPPFDQRGVARPQPLGGTCDIGAVELLLPHLYLPLVQK
jgi:hypothetical protein